ncbi:MAG: diaminopimelate epimerase [candidate division Zixibacteria bacterium]|nr:diaminopimelate epimerase [candidate division Zixibacteria bacterium]
MKLKFHKLEAAGNDFVLVEQKNLPQAPFAALAKRLCHRHTGIGADGLIILERGRVAQWRMRIFNADGSDGQTSGNGARCLAHLLFKLRKASGNRVIFETAREATEVVRIRDHYYRVDMGRPVWEADAIPLKSTSRTFINQPIAVSDRAFIGTAVSVGNPHLVLFADSIPKNWAEVGQKLEHHRLFPKGANVEFVQTYGKKRATVAVWERGVGETLACGTGSVAVLAAGVITGRLVKKAKIRMPGGVLDVEWGKNEHLYLSGPVRHLFSGEFEW